MSAEMIYKLRIDAKELERQIKAVLNSNMDEDSISGIHNLLGTILDQTIYNNKGN